MLEERTFLIKLAVVVLLAALARPAFAEMKSSYTASGNNVGVVVRTNNYGGPLSSNQHQFPAGLGNFYSAGRWTWGVHVATDRNGDGVVNDTLSILSRAGEVVGGVNSLEAIDLITSLAEAGENMESAKSRIENNRLYVSTDPDDLADWPPEFREGRSASGAPILHGAQTIASRFGDCFVETGIGQSVEYQFYFLNFGESNNMIYLHVFFRNMSEYVKWHPSPDVREAVANTPDGQIWYGMEQWYATANGFRIGERDEAWAYYFPRQIIVQADRDGSEGNFTGHPAAVAYYQRRNPSLRDETLKMTNTCAQGWNTEFGFYPEEPMESGYSMKRCYRYGLGKWAPAGPFYGAEASDGEYAAVSPWTGKTLDGWPGVLEPEDDRYERWIWGERNANNSYNYWSEFHDVAPQDSFSLDAAIMFVYLDPPNFGFPSSQDLANIDDPDVQTALTPILDYADVADIVAEGGFILPETPAPPPLVIIPGDRQVTITWSDVNINTPDAFYGFLQDNPALDPDGVYKEYDFEGYRLYRSFVGPGDSHSELLLDCSISDGNLQFFWNDVYTKDEPLNRMRNGMKVWYALVPYDSNINPADGSSFSLPDTTSGKAWNRPGGGLFTIEPRSESSEFRAASWDGVATYLGPATVAEPFVELVGHPVYEYVELDEPDEEGNTIDTLVSGVLDEIPKWLEPPLEFTFEVVNNERITQDLKLYVACTGIEVDWGCSIWSRPMRVMSLLDSGNNVMHTASPFSPRDDAELILMNPPDADGVNYAIYMNYNHIGPVAGCGSLTNLVYTSADRGGYTGGEVTVPYSKGCKPPSEGIGNRPSIGSWIRNGGFEVTWKAAGDDMTVEVADKTHGGSVAFSPYPDDLGWGFMPGGTWGTCDHPDVDFFEEIKDGVPQAERENLMLDKIPAVNTEEFALWLNGIVWVLEDISAMPLDGTVFTITTCFGEWNEDYTVFTQYADPPWVGDNWQLDIKASTMNPEDVDLTKIMVVPNPYLASSWLDLSPNSRRIEFVNLPSSCTIRIYSLGGHLVNVLNHIGANRFGWGNYSDWDRLDPDNNPREFTGHDNHGGTEPWNLRNRFGQTVASGLYFFHVTDYRGETYTGKFYIVN